MSTDCLFCKLSAGDIPADIIFENNDIIAFKDINPQAPFHCLVVPRRHITSLDHLEEGDTALAGSLLLAVRDIARQAGIEKSGYRVINNIGSDGGQTVGHIHLHVLGGRPMQWPPG